MKKEELKALKQQLHEQCLHLVSEKISGIQQAMDMLEGSMRDETKSSVGDKYETGREMIKQEVEKLSVQLQEAVKQQQLLQQPNLLQQTKVVQQGALVLCDKGNFYLSVGLGQLVIEEKKFIAVSPISPLAQKMMGLKQADKFIFNAQEYTLLHIL